MQDLYNSYNPDISGLYPERSAFDLGHPFGFSGRLGVLYPSLVQEVLPGDSVDLDLLNEVRFAPTIAPVNWQFKVKSAAFFVPNRQVWDNWEKFITGSDNGQPTLNNQPLTPVHPYINLPVNNYIGDDITTRPHRKVGDIFDFVYVSATPENYNNITDHTKNGTVKVSSLPLRGYHKIINDWFKVENLDADLEVRRGDGEDPATMYMLQSARYEKDYFTAANPWLTKGGDVTIPMVKGDAPVRTGTIRTAYGPRTPMWLQNASNGTNITSKYNLMVDGTPASQSTMVRGDTIVGAGTTAGVYPSNLYAELTNSIALGVDELRAAFQTRKFLQREARAGNRYIESILAHFGVRSSDYRLQRTQYLGGVSTDVASTALYQTSATDNTSPQGNQSGILYAAGTNNNHIRMSFEEHGYLMVITWVMPRTGYYQGISRQFTRFSRWDYYWREFADLDEQAILNKEIYVDAESSLDSDGNPLSKNDKVFGYIGRYDDMRQRQARVAGEMRTTQSYWQYARKFTKTPNLNSDFVKYSGDDRIFAVGSEVADPLWFSQVYRLKMTRPMPLTNDPGLLDHH